MIKIILTNDGVMGLLHNGDTTWFTSTSDLIIAAWNCYPNLNYDTHFDEFVSDVNYALCHLKLVGDTHAEFGVLGSFMYTTKEEESGF